jgi:hypothetical protein
MTTITGYKLLPTHVRNERTELLPILIQRKRDMFERHRLSGQELYVTQDMSIMFYYSAWLAYINYMVNLDAYLNSRVGPFTISNC